MKKIAAIFAVALSVALLPSSVWAQVDGETEKTLKELLLAVKYRDMMAESMQQLANSVPSAMMQATGNALSKNERLSNEQKKAAFAKAEQDSKIAAKEVEAMLRDTKLMDELEKDMVAVYAKYFKLDEIRQILAFYKTPVGTKLTQNYQQMMAEGAANGQKIVIPRVEKQIEKFAAEHAK